LGANIVKSTICEETIAIWITTNQIVEVNNVLHAREL
jgi:hypothetical protein